jgi:hypothetical protein
VRSRTELARLVAHQDAAAGEPLVIASAE